jgi:hypothetical protein
MNAKGKRAFTIVGVSFAIFIVTLTLCFNYSTQRDIAFKNIFISDIRTIEMATTFENMKASFVNIRTNIDSTLPGNPNFIYNTILPWAKTPDNSLQMSIHMINLCIERLDLSISYYQTYKQNASASLVNDWYSTTLTNIKKDWSQTYTFNNIEVIYTIQKYGVFGYFSIYTLLIFVVISLFSGCFVIFAEILGEDLDSNYEITYMTNNITNIYTISAWSETSAIRKFNERFGNNKVIGVNEIK